MMLTSAEPETLNVGSGPIDLQADAERFLRNLNGRNFYQQQIRSFSDLRKHLPHLEEYQSVLNEFKRELRQDLESRAEISPDTGARAHFTLGRLNFLLGDFKASRNDLLIAARYGMDEATVFYNIAMCYAADPAVHDHDREQQTVASLKTVAEKAGPRSPLGIEAVLHIKMIETRGMD